MSIAIEKNVPVPELKERNSYPYKSMDVGDSFFVEDTTTRIMSNNNYRAGKTYERKFVARREGNGVRVWRTE
jgi:hypothetical protein